MNTDLKDAMSKRTDEDLIKIVFVDSDGYQPMAVEAAEEEIKKRNIDKTKIEQVKVDLTAKIEEQKDFDFKKLSVLTRFIHFIVDTIAFIIFTMIFTFVIGLFINPTDQNLKIILRYLMFATGFLVYYVFMETKYQKTIGKFITKTKVVNTNGTKPELGDIVRRTFCRLIPFDKIYRRTYRYTSFLFFRFVVHGRRSVIYPSQTFIFPRDE